MTARQQLARLVPLALLIVLAVVGLRGVVPDPRWNGPLRAYGVLIGLALEVLLAVLLVITLRRDHVAARAAKMRPYAQSDLDDEIEAPAALRFVLKWLIPAGMVAIGAVLIANLHLHLFTVPRRSLRLPRPLLPRGYGHGSYHGGGLRIPIGPILYGLLIALLIAAVVISIWWAARLRRAADAPIDVGDLAEDSEGLRDAVESGRAALAAEIDDARAAIIACYLAMEDSLALRGTARAVADTPDELLARAVSAGLVRGGAARWLTALFYEARFSTHPLGRQQREAAALALDELADELRAAVVS
jgi:hypothetical protein